MHPCIFNCSFDVICLFISQAWEAPWLRANRRDARSTGSNRIPAFQIPANSRRKQDVASLIQERLNQNDLDKSIMGECQVDGCPVVLSKPAPKGESQGC